MSGTVYLVGAGPGDPGLITVKGLEAIKKADVIIYDRLVASQLLIHAKPDTELIYAGKLPHKHTLTQDEINALLVKYALAGKIVTRLKGGDPVVFGRGGEEAECCVRVGVSFEIIPGISSAIAAPAYAGIPVTHRDFNSSFIVITGHERPDKIESSICWEHITCASETLVFLMGTGNLAFIVENLLRYGKSSETPVAVVYYGTRVEQETIVGTLSNIVDLAPVVSPATIIVGDVVKLRDNLSWFEKKPLFGKRVLVTRARSQASELSRKIYDLGGEPVEFPVIRITGPKRPALLDKALEKLQEYDWIIFTSVNGVEYFFRRLIDLKIDVRKMFGARIAAIGPSTADALADKGLIVEVLPCEYKAEALVESLRPKLGHGEKVLLPRANIARKLLTVELEQMGCVVTEVDAYDTSIVMDNAAQIIDLLRRQEIHIVTFTSSSTVRNFVEAISVKNLSLLDNVKTVCIGPITADTARELGVNVDIIADTYTIDGLVQAMQRLDQHCAVL